MGSVVQNGWDHLVEQYLTSIAFTLLYYDYALTLERERRLFWSRQDFKQWGSLLFFLNRYCGIVGHAPVIFQTFAPPKFTIGPLCHHLRSYHQVLAVATQAIVGFTFIARTYALYGRSRVVFVGLTALALTSIAVSGYMLSHGKKLPIPELPEGSVGCLTSSSWSQAWHFAVAWSSVLIFDLIVVVMTLVRTVQINRRSGKDRTLTHVLIRDGVVYFGVIGLATLSNIITLVRGSEITRGAATTMTNILSSVLVSRLMFNLRDPKGYSAVHVTSTMTTATRSAPMSTTAFLHTLTNVDHVEGDPAIHESQNCQGDIEMVPIIDCSETAHRVRA